MKQLSITTQNKPGELNEICTVLGGHGINIQSLMGEGKGKQGIIRLITPDPKSAKNVIEKRGFQVDICDIFTIRIPDKPGELAKITKKLRDAGINIDCIYLLNKIGEKSEIALSADKMTEAKEVLGV